MINVFDSLCVVICTLNWLGYTDFPWWVIIVYLVARLFNIGINTSIKNYFDDKK